MFPCYNMATTMNSSLFENDILLAAKAGFQHIELRKEKLLDYLRRGHSLSASMRSRISASIRDKPARR